MININVSAIRSSHDSNNVKAEFLHHTIHLNIIVGSPPDMSDLPDVYCIFRIDQLFISARLHLYKHNRMAVGRFTDNVYINLTPTISPVMFQKNIPLFRQEVNCPFLPPFAKVIVLCHNEYIVFTAKVVNFIRYFKRNVVFLHADEKRGGGCKAMLPTP